MMTLSQEQARRIWIHTQKLDSTAPFGKGTQATQAAIEQLGYVQIDTINVIERCHHHILYTRIPQYKRKDLHHAQTIDKSIFEFWTHALAYVPTKDFRFYVKEMAQMAKSPSPWYQSVKKEELQKVLRLIKKDGALSIRDIEDDVLVEKKHPWASRKPSKKALQLAFWSGKLVISERLGMLKKYELTERHFNWQKKPKAASETEISEYLLERALRSQGIVSLDSICHLNAKRKADVRKIIERKIKKSELVPVKIAGTEKIQHWVSPDLVDQDLNPTEEMVHILSPFDPLIIQRKRVQALFNYEHRFEAYVPKEKRIFGYFALPVLLDDQIVAALDLKTDRQQKKLLMQKWSWIGKNKSAANKRKIEEELHRFEKFQLDI